ARHQLQSDLIVPRSFRSVDDRRRAGRLKYIHKTCATASADSGATRTAWALSSVSSIVERVSSIFLCSRANTNVAFNDKRPPNLLPSQLRRTDVGYRSPSLQTPSL